MATFPLYKNDGTITPYYLNVVNNTKLDLLTFSSSTVKAEIQIKITVTRGDDKPVSFREYDDCYIKIATMSSSTPETVSFTTSGGATTKTVTIRRTLQASDFFSASNANVKNVTTRLFYTSHAGNFAKVVISDGSVLYANSSEPTPLVTSVTVRHSIKPTFSSISKAIIDGSGEYIFAGIAKLRLTVNSISVKNGGNVRSLVATVGGTTISHSEWSVSSGTYTKTITLAEAGTITPKITVTDSRDNSSAVTEPSISVKEYTSPTIDFTVQRVDSSGSVADEGTNALITANIAHIDGGSIITLIEPTVSFEGIDGTAVTGATVAWYSDAELTTAVSDWNAVASGQTVYALVSGNVFNTQNSYNITVTPRDDHSSGTAITRTLGSAYYTVDFLAGGHGIAFGAAATEEEFFVNMDAHFGQDVYVDEDTDLYNAITALGWTDVIV